MGPYAYRILRMRSLYYIKRYVGSCVHWVVKRGEGGSEEGRIRASPVIFAQYLMYAFVSADIRNLVFDRPLVYEH